MTILRPPVLPLKWIPRPGHAVMSTPRDEVHFGPLSRFELVHEIEGRRALTTSSGRRFKNRGDGTWISDIETSIFNVESWLCVYPCDEDTLLAYNRYRQLSHKEDCLRHLDFKALLATLTPDELDRVFGTLSSLTSMEAAPEELFLPGGPELPGSADHLRIIRWHYFLTDHLGKPILPKSLTPDTSHVVVLANRSIKVVHKSGMVSTDVSRDSYEAWQEAGYLDEGHDEPQEELLETI